MSGPERLIMAGEGGESSPTGPGKSGGAALAERPGAVVAPGSKPLKIGGEGPMPDVPVTRTDIPERIASNQTSAPDTDLTPDDWAAALNLPVPGTTSGGGDAGGAGGRDGGGGDSGSGGTGGGGTEGPRVPGGPEFPEGLRGPENEANPELGRWLVEQIVEMRTARSYEERYSGENGRRLRWLYDSLQDFVDKICEIRNDEDPFGPHQAYPRPTQRQTPDQLLEPPQFPPLPQAMQDMEAMVEQFRGQYQLEDEETGGFPIEPLPDPTDTNRSINARIAQYHTSTNRGELEAVQEDLQLYFRQAKNHGLLREVDVLLNLTYQDITSPHISSEQKEALLERGIARARIIAPVEFQERLIDDPTLPVQLADVGDAYIVWASRRMERYLHGQPQINHREGEWSVPTTEKETFWELGHYPKLYVVTAETEEQFLIAKETFLQMVRSGAIGKSPTAIFEHVKNFTEFFSAEGGKRVREKKIGRAFLEENRLELEGLLDIFVIAYSKEVYNQKQSKDAAMALALDEGPARVIAAYRAGRGGVAGFTQIFDYEEVMDIFMNPVGERGELNIAAGHYLQDQIQEIVIERGIGRVLKDYDRRDINLSFGDLGAKIQASVDLERIKSELARTGRIREKRDRARYNAYRTNLRRLGLTKSSEEFKALYESFDTGNYHIQNYQQFAEDQSKPENERQFPSFVKLPESIRKSINLGRVQAELEGFRQAIRNGKLKLEAGEKIIDLLSPADQEIFQAAYDEVEANFDIAFQMQSVFGEKARRGRGFLYVERNPYIQHYFKINEGLRMKWIDPERTKVLNTDTIQDIKEIEKTRDSLPQNERRSFEIGWMLYKLRNGKDLTTFPQRWQELYAGLPSADKEVFVDNIPTYQAENWVQWGVTWTKMKYADDGAVWEERGGWKSWADPISVKIRQENKAANKNELSNFKAQYRRAKVADARGRLIEEIRSKGYAAQLLDEPGPKGEQRLMMYKRPLGRVDPTTGQFRKYVNGEVLGYSQVGQEMRLYFDNNGNSTGLNFDQEGKLLVYDRNGQRINYENFNQNIKARLVGDTLVEEVVPTFQFAALSGDFRSRYTDHTYWYYQGNNRVTILTPKIWAAAQRIRDGLSRPEDEDILASQLLIVDPTMRRIKKFEDAQQAEEVALIAAAVLESYQDRQRIKHLIYDAFLPRDGYIGRMRVGYRNEDWAGLDRFTFGYVEFAAQQTLRLARRYGANLANTPMEHDAAGPRWGVHGVSGAAKVLADNIKQTTKQGIVGQFGLTKIFEVFDEAVNMFYALTGAKDPQTGEHIFGLHEKPTDNNEKLHKYYDDAKSGDLLSNPSKAIPFLYDFIQAFNRLQKVTHIMRTAYSDNDNSAGALNLENVDVFLEDGSFNAAIEADRNILRYNGTARNRQYAFLYGEEGIEGYYNWLVRQDPGGGSDIYRRERFWNSLLKQKYHDFEADEYKTYRSNELAAITPEAEELEVWLTEKII